MSILVIGLPEQAAIAKALETAKANPIPWTEMESYVTRTESTTLMLADRVPGSDEVREKYKPQQIMLGTYRAALSFENQPLGLCKHLSVSSHHRGKIPAPAVMDMVCEAFGFSGLPLKRPGRVWLEEFEPGRMAINVVEVEP